MSITIQNLRIIPYGQKDTLKPVFGDTMHFSFRLADAPQEGDRYLLGLDYERILFPTMRPLCAYTEEYTASQSDVSFDLEINTERFALWVSGLKKPTPIWLQMVRVRGEEYTTILLDDILALPSVVDGANMVFPGTPLEDILREKADLVGGKVPLSQLPPIGFEQVQSDWDESDSSEPSYIRNKPTDFGSQQATDAEIDARESTTHAITPNNLDYAARSVLPNVTTIPAATTSYSLLDASATTNNHSWQYFHAPEAASTYTFPAVTNTTVAHRIKLTIDFTAVQTYSFEDAEGTAIVPLFTPTISAGDVYEFRCEYSAVQSRWLIYPCKEGAVSDDYVMQSQVGVANGVASLDGNGTVPASELPKAVVNGDAGIAGVSTTYGLTIASNGVLAVRAASETNINTRGTGYLPIVPTNLNYAVTAALTDSHRLSLTDAQKETAQDTLGAYGTLHLDAAPTTSTVGAFGQRAIVDSTGKAYTCTAVTTDDTDPQNPVTTYTWKEDLPVASGSTLGGIICGDGLYVASSKLYVYAASEFEINNRSSAYKPIVTQRLPYAVRSVLPNVTVIPAATTAYSLLDASATTNNHSWQYAHAPESAPTYTLPAVTDTGIAHSIILDINFSAVQTFSFEDADGNALSLQKDITVSAGDKYRFICVYQYGMWLIYPLQLKAETVTPTTPVSITGDTATAVSVQLSATASGNGILSYNATGLPAGVACSSSGLISGTPTNAGTTTATVTVKTPYSKPATITVNFDISAGSSTPQSLTVSGTGAQSNSLDGTYTITNDTNNSRPVWYNSTNQKYLFAVENGMDAGWFAWVVGGSVVQQSAGDTMMFYTYCTYDVQGLSNLSESPDQSTTAWYSMGMEVSSSEFDVSVTA